MGQSVLLGGGTGWDRLTALKPCARPIAGARFYQSSSVNRSLPGTVGMKGAA